MSTSELWLQNEKFREELDFISGTFLQWNFGEKKMFLNQLVQRVIPNKLFLLAECLDDLNFEQSESFVLALRTTLALVDGWCNVRRNLMVDHLEELDPDSLQYFNTLIRDSSGQL
eukprot:scpid19179/ scgid33142/ 